jgi:hypothetical protein
VSVHEVLPMKKLIIAVAVIVLGAVAGYAQGTPTLALAAGKVGITSGQNGTASNGPSIYLHKSAYRRLGEEG